MRHRDTPVGGFLLAGKEGGFTDRDEAVLVLFAQQAAAAMAHARAHLDERRAKANLEASVETSPIGVVVFDAETGALLSFNREAKRIVAGLRTPGRPIERFAEAVTCRRGDGREVTLADLRTAERVRAEEVELSVPEGRSVRTLLDATPIRSEEGAVETVVVTIQDLAPFEALERSRAEFLGMVSHELRAPLAALKVRRRRRSGMRATPTGYAPVVTAEPGEVPRLVETRRPRLVLVDLVLPVTDGIALMESLPALAGLPVTFISAYGRGDTVAKALEAAADYIVKPFSPAELVARVRLALRRRTGPGHEPFLLGDLAIDYEKRRVTLAGRPVHLTATKYGLLRALSLDAGGVTTYDSLLRQVRGEHAGSNAHPVRTAVKKLRRKLGDQARKPRYIFTERAVGYRMPEGSS